jgi:hypothetical protein
MQILSSYLRRAFILSFALIIGMTSSYAQTARDAGGYSDSDVATSRSRTASNRIETDPVTILRAARTIYVKPNEYIDAEYLEYKLDKLPEFAEWKLVFVRDSEKADLVVEFHRKALNYIFSVVEPQSSVVVTKGKVVAINGLVAAEDISKEIVKKMKDTRALPTSAPE